MKNNIFIKSTLILIIGGFITKLLGFIIRIIYTRIVGEEGISLYTIITPTYSLIITIAASFLPVAISKLISEQKYKSSTIIFNSVFIILLVDLLLIFVLCFSSKYISINLLKEKRTLLLLYSIIFTIPFVSASSVFKGYYLGKQKMHPNVVSNIIEQIIRILLIIILIPILYRKNLVYGVVGLILISVITETISCLVFILYLPRRLIINKNEAKLSFATIKDILKTSIPLTSGRLIGNIGYFFEPIILTNILTNRGFSSNYVLTNYGIYNAYAISLLALPNFFILAISSAILPEISKYYSKKNYKMTQKRYKQALFISLILGLFFSLFILLFRNQLLLIIYKTTKGSSFIKILAPAFVLFYLEGPITSTLQAIGKSKSSFHITTIGIIIKLIVMTMLAYLKYGIYSLIIAEIANIFIVVLLGIIRVKKELF